MPYSPQDQRDYAKAYYQAHKKEKAAYMRQWRARNQTKHRAYMTAYMQRWRAGNL